MAFTRINIAVKPSQEVVEQAIKLSHEISKAAKAFFVLDGINFFPHITIYSPEYPSDNLEKVYNTINEIVSITKPFIATITSFNSHLGYIDIALEKTEQWKSLHETIIQRVNVKYPNIPTTFSKLS